MANELDSSSHPSDDAYTRPLSSAQQNPIHPEEPSGSWHNPQVEVENRRYRPVPTVNTVASYAQRTKPRFSGLRKFLAILLALVALCFGTTGATAYWVQENFVDSQGFSEISASMAHDSEFQHELAEGVTNDLMKSEAVTKILGDGNSKSTFDPFNILGAIKDWSHDQVEAAILSATTTVVESESYPEVWQQVMNDTHDYNLDDSKTDSVIDVTAIYQKVDEQVGTVLGFDPDLVGSERHLINLDSQNGTSLNSTFKDIKNFAETWTIQLIIAGAALILAFFIWPRGKLLFTGIIVLLAGAILWFGSIAAEGISQAARSLNITSGVGQVFIQGIANQYAHSLADFASSFVVPTLIIAAALIVLGIAAQIAGLTRKSSPVGSR